MDLKSLGNPVLKQQAEDYFADFISRCIGLSPTEELTKMATASQIAASDLKKGSSGHFAEFTPEDTHKQWLTSSIQYMFRRLEGRKLMTHIGRCMGMMMTKVASTMGSEGSPHIRSENELRYAIGDPIMDMLVQCWGYQVTNCIVNFAKATVQFPNRLGLRSKWTRSPQWNRLIPVRAQGQRRQESRDPYHCISRQIILCTS